ncbi:MAG TPA: Hpt domain-containing protein [Acidimicrobiales bacterium]|nr:Hpt domain-containing protein [Acidimicrobiales bacterium]
MLDQRQVAQLLNLATMDPARMARVVEDFIAGAARRLDELVAVADRDGPAALLAHAHALKGNSASFGAHRVAALCVRLEVAGRAADAPGATETLEALEVELVAAARALRRTFGLTPGGDPAHHLS